MPLYQKRFEGLQNLANYRNTAYLGAQRSAQAPAYTNVNTFWEPGTASRQMQTMTEDTLLGRQMQRQDAEWSRQARVDEAARLRDERGWEMDRAQLGLNYGNVGLDYRDAGLNMPGVDGRMGTMSPGVGYDMRDGGLGPTWGQPADTRRNYGLRPGMGTVMADGTIVPATTEQHQGYQVAHENVNALGLQYNAALQSGDPNAEAIKARRDAAIKAREAARTQAGAVPPGGFEGAPTTPPEAPVTGIRALGSGKYQLEVEEAKRKGGLERERMDLDIRGEDRADKELASKTEIEREKMRSREDIAAGTLTFKKAELAARTESIQKGLDSGDERQRKEILADAVKSGVPPDLLAAGIGKDATDEGKKALAGWMAQKSSEDRRDRLHARLSKENSVIEGETVKGADGTIYAKRFTDLPVSEQMRRVEGLIEQESAPPATTSTTTRGTPGVPAPAQGAPPATLPPPAKTGLSPQGAPPATPRARYDRFGAPDFDTPPPRNSASYARPGTTSATVGAARQVTSNPYLDEMKRRAQSGYKPAQDELDRREIPWR